LETQQKLVSRMMEHWLKGYGAEYNPTRKEALLGTRVVNVLDEAVADITQTRGKPPKTVVTSAKQFPQSRSYQETRAAFKEDHPHLLVLGTGWGLEKGAGIITCRFGRLLQSFSTDCWGGRRRPNNYFIVSLGGY
jgi:hypothetical protein